jgi:hypothetical protein
MATRRKAPEAPEDDAQPWQMPTGQMLPALPDEESAADRITTLLQGVEGDDRAFVNVSRMEKDGKLAFCARYEGDVFEGGDGLQRLRDDWGAGSYLLVVYGSDPGGGRGVKIRTRMQVSVAASLRPIAPSTATASAPAGSNDELLQTMRQLVEAVTHREPPPDPTAQLVANLQMMKMMREAFGMARRAQASKPTPLHEVLTAIKEIKGVSKMLNR